MDICKFNQIKNSCQCICCIEVVFHCFFEFGYKSLFFFQKCFLCICCFLYDSCCLTVTKSCCCICNSFQCILGRLHKICTEIQWTSVMCIQHKESQHLKIILLTDFTNSTEVAKGFGHLTVINIQECIMHPVSCKSLAIAAFALCDLILMMREDKVFSTCMDIDFFAKIFL